MPDSFGKRQRNQAKARKANAREERRLARNQRRADRAAGVLPSGPEIAPNEPVEFEAAEPPADAEVPEGSGATD